MQVVIYPNNETGGLSVMAPNLASGLSVEQIAIKDVPPGLPYLIVDHTELPQDADFQDAWEADFSEPDGYGGNVFPEVVEETPVEEEGGGGE